MDLINENLDQAVQEVWYTPLEEVTGKFYKVDDPRIIDDRSQLVEDGAPSLLTAQRIAMGSAILKNSMSVKQKMQTGAFSKTTTTTCSTTASKTWTFGGKIALNMTFGPSFFKTGVTMEFSMSCSTQASETKTKSESVTYTLPSQSVDVEPHSTVYVNAYLETKKATGKVIANIALDGDTKFYYYWIHPMTGYERHWHSTLYDIVSSVEKNGKTLPFVKLVPNSNIVLLSGATYTYTVDAAFNVGVEFSEKPLNEGGKVIQRLDLSNLVQIK